MFPTAPRILVWLVLAIFLVRLGFAFLTPGTLVFPMLQIAFLSFIAWKTLSGSQGAAFFLGALLVLGVLDAVYQLVTMPDLPAFAMAIVVGWASLLTGTAWVIFFHAGVRRFYAERAKSEWRVER